MAQQQAWPEDAPVQQKMPEQAQLQPQPKIPGNGCPCQCCGASPSDIRVEDIKKHGNEYTRWIQKPDGRIIEYYVYGSDKPDAKIFLQFTGSFGDAITFTEFATNRSVLEEKNVKGISLNVPGHGFTSSDPLMRMGNYAKSDVTAVLKAEGVPDDAPLMVEGTSFGSNFCYSVLHHFQDRITHVHLHVPALSWEVAMELKKTKATEGCSCDGKAMTSCFLCPPGNCCSPCLFCCCANCMAPMTASGAGADDLKKLPGYAEMGDLGYDPVAAFKKQQAHVVAAGFQGALIYQVMNKQNYTQWGFHPFNDIQKEYVEKMKIQISYGEKDTSSPEDNGEYMAKYYSELCNKDGKTFKNEKPEDVVGNDKGGKCLVRHGPGGHVAHMIPFFSGDLVRSFLEL
jgi:pimeloyl-ACP methyl ester carboxylesterase